MFRCWPAVRIAAFGLLLAGHLSAAVAADPFVLFLLRMLRDQVISSAIESGVTSAQRPAKPAAPAPAQPAPQPPAETQWLRGLIDESFIHLSPAQRDELHASLLKILNDPRYEKERPTILGEFTAQAVAMRDAHRQLSRLSEPDMRRLALEARVEFEKLPPDQRQQLMQALQQGVPGMPRALSDMLVAEFGSVPAAR